MGKRCFQSAVDPCSVASLMCVVKDLEDYEQTDYSFVGIMNERQNKTSS